MDSKPSNKNTQPDNQKAAEERPIPSQAEGADPADADQDGGTRPTPSQAEGEDR